MLQAGGQLDLAKEPLATERLRQIGTQHFDCDFAIVLVVVGEVDRGHPARSELALESIVIGERIGQGGGGLHAAKVHRAGVDCQHASQSAGQVLA